MNITFLGVGEAFDEVYSNTSFLVHSKSTLLIDCGYAIPHQLWKKYPDTTFIRGIFISHGHADHYFGIPPLLVKMWEEKRTQQLTIICSQEVHSSLLTLLELGYKGILSKMGFVKFVIAEKNTLTFQEFTLSFSYSLHSIPVVAISINDGKHILCYSGDGMYSPESAQMYTRCDLLIHESYTFDREVLGHASIQKVIAMAHQNNIKRIALVHLQRDTRKNDMGKIASIIKEASRPIEIPEPGQTIQI